MLAVIVFLCVGMLAVLIVALRIFADPDKLAKRARERRKRESEWRRVE